MSIKSYSKLQYGYVKLSTNFTVKEFSCKDGSDYLLIDDDLVTLVQRIRNWANAPVTISSAYRNPAYNKKVGGTSNSYHTKGKAADLIVEGKTAAQVAKFAEAIGAKGIGCYTASKFTHVDTRTTNYRWKNSGSGNVTVTTHGGKCPYKTPTTTVKLGDDGDKVRWVQWWLNLWGADLTVDGGFGKKTEAAIKDLQRKLGLDIDGKVGPKTKNGLLGYYRIVAQ